MLNAMEDQVKRFLLVVVTLAALAAGPYYYSLWQGMISKLLIACFHEQLRRQMVLLCRKWRARAAASASRTAAAFSRRAATATAS